MRLITKIKIEGFRSIRQAEIKGLSGFTAFAGLNNSGKSNVLRALNAFFNDETDEGNPVIVDVDYHRPDLRKKQRKRIRVSVDFNLPTQFRFRQGLRPIENLLGGRSFSVTKEWVRDPPMPSYSLNGNDLSLEDQQKLRQFLSLIKFRYIPNRVLPTELIRNEHQNLRDVLVRRLTSRAPQDQRAFRAIQSASAKMIDALAKRFTEACPGEGEVNLVTPTSWKEMAFAFGYKLARNGIEIEDIAQGSGIQSLLMLETLYLIDRDYFQQFGWRQAAIWAVEEPESSLHSSLEARMAAYLSGISSDKLSRLQVLCTTHSDLIVQYAKRSIVVEQKDGQTSFEVTSDPKVALDRLSKSGVSRWVHPILHYPLDPIILVEGKYDVVYLREAIRILRPSLSVRIADLPSLDETTGGGGVDRLRKYLQDNASAIKTRRKDAPVVVVLDWDSRGSTSSFSRLISSPDVYKVLAWPDEALNPKIGKSFKGIERAYSERIIKKGIAQGAQIGLVQNKRCTVSSDDYGDVKSILSNIVRKGLKDTDLSHSRRFLESILSAAGNTA